jgi:hypothetical protein
MLPCSWQCRGEQVLLPQQQKLQLADQAFQQPEFYYTPLRHIVQVLYKHSSSTLQNKIDKALG